MADYPSISELNSAVMANLQAQNSSPTEGPTYVDTSYEFGDWITGKGKEKRQAAAQAQADWAEYQRNVASAREERDWQEYMDSTSVQRRIKDIEAAGLNPWLALQGSGFGGGVTSQGATAHSNSGQYNSTSNNATATAIAVAAIVKLIAALAA